EGPPLSAEHAFANVDIPIASAVEALLGAIIEARDAEARQQKTGGEHREPAITITVQKPPPGAVRLIVVVNECYEIAPGFGEVAVILAQVIKPLPDFYGRGKPFEHFIQVRIKRKIENSIQQWIPIESLHIFHLRRKHVAADVLLQKVILA